MDSPGYPGTHYGDQADLWFQPFVTSLPPPNPNTDSIYDYPMRSCL